MAKKSNTKHIDPIKAAEFYNLAVKFQQNNQIAEAESAYRAAVRLNPDFAEAHNNLGNVLKEQGRLKEALHEYRHASKIYKNHPIMLNNIGYMLLELGDINQAIQYLSKSIEFDNNYIDPLNNLANAYSKLNKYEDSLKYYVKAIEINPNVAEVHFNLACLMSYLKRPEDAVKYYKNTLQLDPGNISAASGLYHELSHLCDWSEIGNIKNLLDQLLASEEARKLPVTVSRKLFLGTPFQTISRTENLESNYLVSKVASQNIENSLHAIKIKSFNFRGRKKYKKRLRIGYLSNDFYDHATMHLIMGVFREHEKDRVEFVCYDYSHEENEAYRKKIAEYCSSLKRISGTSDFEAAKMIYRDDIDILVDLKGYTQDARLGICAYRPAPIQVTYLGFPGTSGANFFDYILTDKIVTPPSHAKFYSEKFVYLPDTYQPNDNQQKINDKIPSRLEMGLPEKGFIFCSFNQSYKLEPVFFDIWMYLLHQVNESVLWLYVNNEAAINNIKREAVKRNIEPERLVFAERLPKSQHLARLVLADLVLDTRIVNGHTTTADALWAGVPVVTLQGQHFASRVSSSLLHAVGLKELITTDLDSYKSLALRLAMSPNELDNIRDKLHQNRTSYPLFNTKKFTRNLEEAYRLMWERYVSGKKPDHIEVSVST